MEGCRLIEGTLLILLFILISVHIFSQCIDMIITLICFSLRYPCFSINWHSSPSDSESYLLQPCNKQCHKVVCESNRANLRFEIHKVPKNLMLSKLDWIVQMVKVENISMPKTIRFCNTINALTQIVNT